MVSSELVVLLIVCVSTGSTQGEIHVVVQEYFSLTVFINRLLYW